MEFKLQNNIIKNIGKYRVDVPVIDPSNVFGLFKKITNKKLSFYFFHNFPLHIL